MSREVVRRMPAPREPRTREEWQEAADAAEGALALDSARKYGLVTGGPVVDVERCTALIDAARAGGITPAKDAIERFVAAMREASAL